MSLTPDHRALIDTATSLQGKFGLEDDFSAAAVAAALRTADGNVYTGVCIDLACGIGFCAEHAAVAEMLKHHETRIAAIVAVGKRGVLPPCGRCRELMLQVDVANADTQIILRGDRTASLSQLLPEHWLDEYEK